MQRNGACLEARPRYYCDAQRARFRSPSERLYDDSPRRGGYSTNVVLVANSFGSCQVSETSMSAPRVVTNHDDVSFSAMPNAGCCAGIHGQFTALHVVVCLSQNQDSDEAALANRPQSVGNPRETELSRNDSNCLFVQSHSTFLTGLSGVTSRCCLTRSK